MISNIGQAGNGSSHNRQRSRVAARFLVMAIAFLLMIGYLGVNLLDFPSQIILTLRICSVVILFALLVPELRNVSVPISLFVVLAVWSVGAFSSSILLNLLFTLLFVLATRSILLDYLVSVSIWALLAATLLTLVFLHLDFIFNDEDIVELSIELGGELRSRLNFGYKNVNSFASIISSLCLLIMVRGKLPWLRCTAALVVSYLVYDQTDSRSMVIATVFFVVYFVIASTFRHRRQFFYVISASLIAIPTLVSLFPRFFIDEVQLLDLQLSGRLNFVAQFYSELSPLNLILGGADPKFLTIDNAFALIVGAAGVPFLLFLVLRVIAILRICIWEYNYRIPAFLVSFWMYSFVESSLVRPETLVGLVFWALVLRPKIDVLNLR